MFFSFSLVSSRLSPISVPFPVLINRRMSVRPPVLWLFVSRRVSYLIWYFVVRSTVYNGLPCVLPLLVLASVRLLLVFGRVFGRFLVFGRVFGRFLVFGRAFGCYECLAVCSAVTIFGLCVQLLQALAVRSAVSTIARFCYFLHVFICTFFYLFRALPIHLSRAPSFFLVVPSILFRHVLSRTRIFSRSFYSSIFYFCSALFMHSVFLHNLCVLILLCFGRDFCFLLFRSYSRALFFPRRAFVLFCYSCGFSFLFYAMRFS